MLTEHCGICFLCRVMLQTWHTGQHKSLCHTRKPRRATCKRGTDACICTPFFHCVVMFFFFSFCWVGSKQFYTERCDLLQTVGVHPFQLTCSTCLRLFSLCQAAPLINQQSCMALKSLLMVPYSVRIYCYI